jgi:O-antigen ligase
MGLWHCPCRTWAATMPFSALDSPEMTTTLPTRPAALEASVAVAEGSARQRLLKARRTVHHDRGLSLATWAVLAAWIVALCAPNWWLAEVAFPPAAKIGSLALGAAVLAIIARPQWVKGAYSYIAFTVFIAATLPTAMVPAYHTVYLKFFIGQAALVAGIVSVADSPTRLTPFLRVAFAGQFAWFLVFGLPSGLVWWHPDLSNYDAFGPLMCIGAGMAFFYGMSTDHRWWRLAGFALALLCVLGVVASFARGAVLSLVAVVGWAWFRAPNKKQTTLALVAGLAAVVAGALLFSGEKRGGNDDSPTGFLEEMSTLSEGTDDGTASDRLILWSTAVRVWKEHPYIGSGMGGFGPAAIGIFRPGEIGGEYADNIQKLYDRAIHNTYLQMLSETGLVGTTLYLLIIVDFVRRNRRLQRPEARARWAARGGTGDIRALAWGLEAGMVGYVASNMFYNQLYEPWLAMLVGINAALVACVSADAPVTTRSRRR